jgi:hypothetical protein
MVIGNGNNWNVLDGITRRNNWAGTPGGYSNNNYNRNYAYNSGRRAFCLQNNNTVDRITSNYSRGQRNYSTDEL